MRILYKMKKNRPTYGISNEVTKLWGFKSRLSIRKFIKKFNLKSNEF